MRTGLKAIGVTIATLLCSSVVTELRAQEQRSGTDDREIALWILRKGGRVLFDGAAAYTSDPFDLPERGVQVVGVDMHGTVVPPIELKPLAKLTNLREVMLPARVWSPTFD